MRKVLYVSGTRADYGPIRSTLKLIDETPSLDLSLLVTGMHLDPIHGETWQQIEEDGFTIAERVYGRIVGDSLGAMSASVGMYLFGMSQAFERLKPDLVLVLGDRGEMLAGAIAAAVQNIPVVHLCGGSISGSIDDSIRHAITKFAHYHLPANEEHAQRIIQMGEDPEKVRIVGLPGGDIRPDVTYSKKEVCNVFSLSEAEPYLLIVQHSVTHSQERAGAQIIETLEAVVGLGCQALLANPNDDAGGRVILQTMKDYANRYPRMQILPPLRSRELYASIMANSGALVGNSSCGTVEAMSLGVPVVNVGDRQRGREATSCLLNVDHDRNQISQALKEALCGEDYRRQLQQFSSGLIANDTPSEVVKTLLSVDLNMAKSAKVFFMP